MHRGGSLGGLPNGDTDLLETGYDVAKCIEPGRRRLLMGIDDQRALFIAGGAQAYRQLGAKAGASSRAGWPNGNPSP